VRLAGNPSRHVPATRVLDPIEISAVLLECGASRCLIFSFDLMIVGSELERKIHSRLVGHGFSPHEVVLLASHTHSAPATDRACERLGVADPEVVKALADAAEDLVRRIQAQPPSEIDLNVYQGHLNHSINRRRYWPFPTFGRRYGLRLTGVCFAPNPSGARDERITVILLRQVKERRVLGVMWHYTCHPTAVVPDDVISSDYPGVIRQALRQRFGEIPCIFVQGFCGDSRPNVTSSVKVGFWERVRRAIRLTISGPEFPICTADDWKRWSQSMALRVHGILQGTLRALPTTSLQCGSARLALDTFFSGSTPAKELSVQIVRIGKQLEIVALSAEVTVPWQAILDAAVAPPVGGIRLYAGYAGALFGYLPTATQVAEGGYEVEGFQPLFGLSGHFEVDRIEAAVTGCVRSAFEDLERRAHHVEPSAFAARARDNR
jgi:hypothetical protein